MLRRILILLAFFALLEPPVLVHSMSFPFSSEAGDGTGGTEKKDGQPTFSFTDNMEERMIEEVDRVSEQLQEKALSLFERTPLGFDFQTIERLETWSLGLPARLPTLIVHIREQSRLLGFVGSLIMLAFLGAVVYSLIGQDKVLRRVEDTVEPLRKKIPDVFYPFFLSALKVVVASLIPLLLFGTYCLVSAATSYSAPWFRLTGSLLKLWMLGALIINVLREALTRDLFPISSKHGISVFRVTRIVVLYILACIAILWGAEAFQIPRDFLALLKFLISLCIVIALLMLLLKKRALLNILPDLPYDSYRVFVRGLDRFYFPAIFLTFLTGLMWCLGFHTLCKTIWIKTWAVAGAFLAVMLSYHLLQGWLQGWREKRDAEDPKVQPLYRAVRTLLIYSTVTSVLMITMNLLGILVYIQRLLSLPLVQVGQSPLSLWTLTKATLILMGFVFGSRLIRTYLDYRIYPSLGFDEGLSHAINMFLSYTLWIAGCLFAMRSIGMDLRVLLIFAGALGIGLGLGLQNTAANLISGFSIVFGRRIRKGDWIQVEDTIGCVEDVGLRCARVRSRDNVEYLIPNADLTSRPIVNYSLGDPLVRLHVPLGVAYGTDPRMIEDILLKVAGENPLVMKNPAPEVRFIEYGDNALLFELLAWMDIRKNARDKVRSNLNFAMHGALAAAKIEIPYPQRDVHIRSGLEFLKEKS